MSSIEIRHLALDYAVKTAQSGEPASHVLAAAKAFEAYLADPVAKISHPTATQEQPSEAQARFERAVSENVITVLDEAPLTYEEENRRRQAMGDARRQILDATSRLQSAIMRPGVTTEELRYVAAEESAALLSVVNLLGGES